MKEKTSTKDLEISSNERLYIENTSIFKPKQYSNLFPTNFSIYSFHAGFKKKNNDLLLVIFNKNVNVHCVYSKTSTPSAPIIWDKKNNKGKCKILVVNSGNANAHTGNKGILTINKYAKFISDKMKCKKSEILVSSTGVIGEIFNPKLIINSLNKFTSTKKTDLLTAAKSIITTDTYPKTSLVKIRIENKIIKIYGFAKGSGMIQPNMGTMLAYIFIECSLTNSILKKLINQNIENTFNSITVDSDTSTSDTLMLFSCSDVKINFDKKNNLKILNSGVYKVMKDLSEKIIKDGEGLSKLIEVKVQNAKKIKQAKNIAFSIANSPLVKSAISGEDANWGRIVMAIGKTSEKIIQNKIKIFFGKNLLCKNGSIFENINLKNLDKYMKKKIITIVVDLGIGKFNYTVLGNDLTNKYLKINSDYRS